MNIETKKSDVPTPKAIPEADREFFEKYMEKKMARTPNSRNLVYTIAEFYEFVGKAIPNMSYKDIDDWIEHIDTSQRKPPSKKQKEAPKKRKYSSKQTICGRVRAYVIRAIDYHNRHNGCQIPSLFPVDLELSFDDAIDDEDDDEFATIPDDIMEKLLDYSRAGSLRDYVLFLLLKHCGLRISEVRTIKRSNLFLEERRFKTGVVRGSMKSNIDGKHPLEFFFPKKIVPTIRQYLLTLPEGTEWLFPSPLGNSNEYFKDTQYMMTKYSKAIGFHLKSHSFRKTIITKRLNMGCEIWMSHLLVWHKVKDTELQWYFKLKKPERRALFEKWDPWK